MTNVQMLVHITGGRADGTQWPDVGHDKPLKVSPAEAEDLYRAQVARPWPGGDDDERAAEAETEQAQAMPEEAAPVQETAPEAEPDSAQVQVQYGPPRPAASKAEWAQWARQKGASDEWVASATKQEMMEQYGARL